MEKIIIKGARENNLKNVSLELPKNKFIVMTGVSGSGKSSLAFDTIYKEGERRYLESLSAYARQFLGGAEKPDVDVIEGLSPAISIDQKTTNKNPRSTVGTVTEIYDHLRLLFSKAGTPYCPEHHIPIKSQSIEEMTSKILELEEKTKLIISSPVVEGKKGTHNDLLEDLRKNGYVRVNIDNKEYDLSEDMKIVVMSTTEGNDKPFKYPLMFKSASVVILNKLDIIDHTNFDINEFYRDIRMLNKNIKVFEVSCKDNRGIEELSDFLKSKIREKKIMNS